MTTYDRFRWAEDLFEHRDYISAARVLEELLAEAERAPRAHGLTGARVLLARSSYHSGQLGRAEDAARAVLSEDPTEAYAALLLARTLQRRSRPQEAQRALKVAAALGAPAVLREEQVA